MDYAEGLWSHPDESTVIGPRMGYFSNDSQLVTDTDAAALSAALRRALEHPIEPAEWRSVVEEFCGLLREGRVPPVLTALETMLLAGGRDSGQ